MQDKTSLMSSQVLCNFSRAADAGNKHPSSCLPEEERSVFSGWIIWEMYGSLPANGDVWGVAEASSGHSYNRSDHDDISALMVWKSVSEILVIYVAAWTRAFIFCIGGAVTAMNVYSLHLLYTRMARNYYQQNCAVAYVPVILNLVWCSLMASSCCLLDTAFV